MPPKNNNRNWNDVQIAIATTAIVTTLGLWNLFAEPAKTVTAQAEEEPITVPPPTEPPLAVVPTAMPQVKIMFTQIAPQTSTVAQPQKVKKKKNNNNNNNGGGGTVTQTQSS
jgi:hypothetical protein